MKSFRALVLALALVFTVGSCAAVVASLPKVIAIVSDASLILDAIDGFVSNVFKAKPDPELEKKVDTAIAKARLALAAANRTATGAENLSQSQLTEAFSDFRVAYQDVLALVGPLGVTTGNGPGNGLKAAPGTLQVPEPLALKF